MLFMLYFLTAILIPGRRRRPLRTISAPKALCGLQTRPKQRTLVWFTTPGQHFTAAGARVIANALRRRAEMGLGVKA